MSLLLGIDVGTTGTKTGLFTEKGELVALASAQYHLLTPRKDWVEQRPEDWWQAVVRTVREVLPAHSPGEVTALSLSTQGGAWLALDEAGQPLGNAVSWMDKRAAEIGNRLEAQRGAEWIYRITGWTFGGGLPLLTTCHLRENEPELFSQVAQFADTHAYLTRRLSGSGATDHSNAAITQFYDLAAGRWSEECCRVAGIRVGQLPRLARAGHVVGHIAPEVAAELGLRPTVKVVAGGHDQYCAALGVGVTRQGKCLLSCGTAWVLLAGCPFLLFDESRRVSPGTHVVEGQWGVLTSVPVAGASLKWFRDSFLPPQSYQVMSEEAARVPAGSEGLVFVPGNYRDLPRSAFVGIDLRHRPGHFVRAIMEGVAFATRRNLESLAAMGVQARELVMIGGAARSACWAQIIADVCGMPVHVPAQTEAACAGAAILAGQGAGIFAHPETAAELFCSAGREFPPDAARRCEYERYYREFLTLLHTGVVSGVA